MNWTDATTYSRGDTERKQTAWQLDTGEIRIWVSNGHRYYRGLWVYFCYNVGVNEARELKLPKGATPEQAQARALALVKAKLQNMIDSLG